MKEINNEKNLKLIAARDVICFFLSKEGLSAEECREVLEMCKKEVDAADKRTSFDVIKKEDE